MEDKRDRINSLNAEALESERCWNCLRPRSLCFCASIPTIDNKTHVLILQHVGERGHPFNTARIVDRALGNCALVNGHNRQFGSFDLPIRDDAVLLYPSRDAQSLTQIRRVRRPSQVVIIDGTWHQAQTIYRDVEQLRNLECVKIEPNQPGNYRIRLEPDSESLSTIEAVHALLKGLEPETNSIDGLLECFTKMVDAQILRRKTSDAPRARVRRKADYLRHIPREFVDEESAFVVAYGESPPNVKNLKVENRFPINWHATRLGSSETFASNLDLANRLPTGVLHHMNLSDLDQSPPISSSQFVAKWKAYIHANDTLVVFHRRTLHLLESLVKTNHRVLVLKSILRSISPQFSSLEAYADFQKLAIPEAPNQPRAVRRMQLAVQVVRHLREMALSGSELIRSDKHATS